MNHSRTKQRHTIAHDDPKSPVSEAFRTLRTNIQFASVDKDLESIMVTSTGPGEGKSTITANLAIVMAQSGKSTLIIDADLRKPTVHHTFRFLNQEGLTSVLTGQSSLEQVVKTNSHIDNLEILTSGPVPPNPAELLGSRAMSHLLEQARSFYEVVIIDTPPVIAVADSQILASQVDGVLLVVSSGKTNQEMAQRAKEQLDNVNANLIGCVLNNKKGKANQQYYYYYGAE